jgi:membrane protease YdiL (CAAX protease family)
MALGAFLTAATLGLACVSLCLPAFRERARAKYAAAAAIYLFVDQWVVGLPVSRAVPFLDQFHWNWGGKALEWTVALVAVALLVSPLKWQRAELGFRAELERGTGKDILRFVGPLLLLEVVALGFLVPPGAPSMEDHLFQMTAPGLAEETAFRGVLLALLDRAFPRRALILRAQLGWGVVVTSVLFGLTHGLDVSSSGVLTFNLLPMAIPLLGGFVLAWTRSRSGSVLPPLLLHAGMNEVALLVGLAKAALR